MAKNKDTQVATTTLGQKELIAQDFTEGVVIKLNQKEKFGLTFPKNYNPTNEIMSAMLILQDTVDSNKKPVLSSCTRASIENALLGMATQGLSITKKQCYPIAYGGKLQCQNSVYGNTCIARRYGLAEINATCIYSGDNFQYHIENAKYTIDQHEQNFENVVPENIIGAYAVATMEDGTEFVEIMNMSQIKQAWKQGYGYRENGTGTHQKFPDQMAEKTVKNRLLKKIINTYSGFGDDREDDVPTYEERLQADVEHDIAQSANAVDFPETEENMTADEDNIVEIVDEGADDFSDFLSQE